MGRRLLSGVALAAVFSWALGVMGATAESDWGGNPTKTIPVAARNALRKALATALDSIPAPPAPYALRPEESTFEVDAKAPWDRRSAKWWVSASATAERLYEVPDEAPGVSDSLRELLGPIELLVQFNGESVIRGLASEGGEPVLFPIDGAAAVEISVVAPGDAGGRVATMTPVQSEYRLAELTLILGGEGVEQSLRNAIEKRPSMGGVIKTTADPSEIGRISIRLHGPKKPVEDFARRIPTASLRRLLHR